MEALGITPNLKKDDLWRRYLDCERRLRSLELEKIDLIQSVRLVFKSLCLLLTRRGFNNDLATVVRRTENRLGFESDCLAIFDQAVDDLSSMIGHDSPFEPIEPTSDENFDDGTENNTLKVVLNNLLNLLAEFKDNRYNDSTEIIKKVIDQNFSLESLVPILVDLCQKFLLDYSKEITNINKRLRAIIRMLLVMEREYEKFLDNSIANYGNTERSFNTKLTNGLGQLHKVVKDSSFKGDVENLLNQLSTRLESLMMAVQKKSEEDNKRLDSLTHEKALLINRLDNVRRDYDNFVSQSHKMLVEMETIKSISLRDGLTGVYNRRAYDEQISMTIKNYELGKLTTFGLIIFDIDFFREVNNSYGHLAGDSILANVGRILKECLRSDDFIFRYGGDEFIIILPEAILADATKVAEKLRQQLELVEFRLNRNSERSIQITISVGVTEAVKGDTSTTIFARADRALYASKREGRNKVTSL
jgi:diguanylate cyclase (GGDEF)-like protein